MSAADRCKNVSRAAAVSGPGASLMRRSSTACTGWTSRVDDVRKTSVARCKGVYVDIDLLRARPLHNKFTGDPGQAPTSERGSDQLAIEHDEDVASRPLAQSTLRIRKDGFARASVAGIGRGQPRSLRRTSFSDRPRLSVRCGSTERPRLWSMAPTHRHSSRPAPVSCRHRRVRTRAGPAHRCR